MPRIYNEINITGEKFGKLTALYRDKNKKSRPLYWIFKCDCGKVLSTQKKKVVDGKIKSCGCDSPKAPLQLIGKRFGELTVISFCSIDSNHRTLWKCQCNCGKEIVVPGIFLTSNKKTSCGCKKNTIRLKIEGKRFNKLTVIEFVRTDSRHRSYWRCKCDCGKERIVRGSFLISGTIKSCGCLNSKFGDPNVIDNLTPGLLGLKKLYSSYKRNAQNLKRNFELTLEEFKEITSRKCFYCGSDPTSFSIHPSKYANKNSVAYKYNGIDRVDSTQGYEKNNIVACCSICNRMKSSYTKEKFLEHIKKINDFSFSKKEIFYARCKAI